MEPQDTPQPFNLPNLFQSILIENGYSIVEASNGRTVPWVHLFGVNDDWRIMCWFTTGPIVTIDIEDKKFRDENGYYDYMVDIDMCEPDSLEYLESILKNGCKALGYIRGCAAHYNVRWGYKTDYSKNHYNCAGTECKVENES